MTTRGSFLAAGGAFACAGRIEGAFAAAPATVTSAYQPGLGYTPFLMLEQKGTLSTEFPSTQFAWRELSNGAVIRDGIISNTIQIGAVGTAPFLIGWDRGVPWKILCDSNNFDFWLVVMDPRIKTLKDLRPGDKIATPSPDAINALVLRAALMRAGLPPNELDVGMVAMPHPIAEEALLNHDVVAHIATPPYAQDEVRRGGHVIMRTADGFPGGITSTVVVAGTSFAHDQPELIDAYFKAFVATVKFIQAHPEDAARAYVASTGGKANLSESAGLFRDLSGSLFGVAPYGVIETARFLAKLGLIKRVPASFAEISLGYVDRDAS